MYITYLLLAVTILLSVKANADDSFKRRLMLNPNDVVYYNKWYRCFTHAFIHADYLHLGFNMFVLYSFGQILEPYFILAYGLKGYFYYALLYIMGILFSCLISIAKYKDNPGYNSLGASGAVMAVLFAFIMVMPSASLRLFLLPIPIPAFILGPLLLLFEYIMSKRGGTGIAHEAHLAGAIFGILFMIAIDYNYLLNFFNNIQL